MKPIENIDLSELAGDQESAYLRDKRAEVGSAIRGIINNIQSWKSQREKSAREIAKLDEKIAKAEAAFIRIKQGDWAAIELPKKDGDQKGKADED